MNLEILNSRLPAEHGSRGIAARVVRLVTLLGVLVLPLIAEPGEPQPSAPKPLVMITAFAWDVLTPDGDLVLNIQVKGRLEPVQIAWRDRSLPLVYEAPGPLVFTKTERRDGGSVEVPVARADVPAGMSRALLVFGRNPASGPGELLYRVKVIDDSYTVFPGQSVRFLNYTPIDLGGSLGGKAFSVAPGADQVVGAALPERNRLLSLKLAKREADGSWKRLRSTGIPMTEGLRVLVFLIADPRRSDQPEMVFIRDRVQPEEPAPATTPSKPPRFKP
jgi:hypothetical protein